MKSVMVGMFDTEAAAGRARDTLLDLGFAKDDVVVRGGDEQTDSSSVAGTSTTASPTHEGAVERFVERFLGADDERRRDGYDDTYREAFQHGRFALTVAADGSLEREKIEKILVSAGAIDVGERSQTWQR
jgi:hypothetical protein